MSDTIRVGEPPVGYVRSDFVMEFLLSVEALLDWMNGNDLSADHEEEKPDDFEKLCANLERLQEALRS